MQRSTMHDTLEPGGMSLGKQPETEAINQAQHIHLSNQFLQLIVQLKNIR
jgi:hypothetical protein